MSVVIGLPVGSDILEFEQAVRSIFSQTYSDWKLIIVCDGSPQSIVDLAQRIEDPRVTVIVDEVNLGLTHRLNQITAIADSEYVMRMDADDLMHPDRVVVQMRYLLEHPEVDVLGAGSFLVTEALDIAGGYREPPLPTDPGGFIASGVLSHPTVVYRREWALANPYDPRWVRTEDKELWLRTSQSSCFRKLPDRLLFCRVPRKLSTIKQGRTAKYDRKLVRSAGTEIVSQNDVRRYIARSLMRQALFWVVVKGGGSRFIHRNKGEPLDPQDLVTGERALNSALQGIVPGWNPPTTHDRRVRK